MFQRMGNAGDAVGLVAAADLVPDLRDHHRGAPIRFDQQPEAVIKLIFRDPGKGEGGDQQGRA